MPALAMLAAFVLAVNTSRSDDLAERAKSPLVGVPAFRVRGRLVIGFTSAETTGARIRDVLDGAARLVGDAGETCVVGDAGSCEGAEDVERVSLPLFGPVAVREIGLPLFTIAIGLLDGFNPCAMWVLLFLLSLLVNVGDRAKMFAIAGTFVVTSGLVYFAFMAAWLNVFLLVGFSAAVRFVLGAIAAVVGLFNLKDAVAPGGRFSLGIPEAAKPKIYARTRNILRSEKLAGALAGVIVLALLAHTVEILYTAGLPAVYTHVLSQRRLQGWAYYGYLALYDAVYMLDDTIMVLAAVVTLNRFKLQERGGRWLKLASGLVMLTLGLTLLAKPEWLAFGTG